MLWADTVPSACLVPCTPMKSPTSSAEAVAAEEAPGRVAVV
jgi:hypothetical protein